MWLFSSKAQKRASFDKPTSIVTRSASYWNMGVMFVCTISLLTSIGAFLNGYGIGSVNGLQNYAGFLETLHLLDPALNSSTGVFNYSDECNQPSELSAESRLILGAMIAAISNGGALATLISGKPADLLGRKPMLLFSAVLIILGGAIQTAALDSWMFIVGRLISGYAYGTIFTAAPTYMAEISPKNIRGRVLALLGPAGGVGILGGYLANFLLNSTSYGWRVSQSVSCVVGLVFFISMAFIPRSPRWLMLHNKEEEAIKVLKKMLPLKDHDSIPLEIDNMKKFRSIEKRSLKDEVKLILNLRVIKRVVLGGVLQCLATLAGNYIYIHSETLFCAFGIKPFVTLIVVGLLSFCGPAFAPIIIDKVGRKCLLVYGGLIISALNGLTGTLILGFNLEEDENKVVGYIVVCLVCIFVLVYSATWYIVPFVITGEMFPPEVRAVGNGISIFCVFVSASIMGQLFPYTFTLLRSYGTLYVVGCVDLVAVFFCLLFFPETKGISLEDMDESFKKSFFIDFTRNHCCGSDRKCNSNSHKAQHEMATVSATNPVADLDAEKNINF